MTRGLGGPAFRSYTVFRRLATYRWVERSFGLASFARPSAHGVFAWRDVSPCVSVELGRMRAEGVAGPVIASPGSAAVWWVTPGVGVRIDVELAGPWFAEPSVGAFFPLVRESFVFALPSGLAPVHQASHVVGEAALGFGAHFR